MVGILTTSLSVMLIQMFDIVFGQHCPSLHSDFCSFSSALEDTPHNLRDHKSRPQKRKYVGAEINPR